MCLMAPIILSETDVEVSAETRIVPSRKRKRISNPDIKIKGRERKFLNPTKQKEFTLAIIFDSGWV